MNRTRKVIMVSPDVHRRLHHLRLDLNKRSINDLVKYLLDNISNKKKEPDVNVENQ